MNHSSLLKSVTILLIVAMILGASVYGCHRCTSTQVQIADHYTKNNYNQVVVETEWGAPRTIWTRETGVIYVKYDELKK